MTDKLLNHVLVKVVSRELVYATVVRHVLVPDDDPEPEYTAGCLASERKPRPHEVTFEEGYEYLERIETTTVPWSEAKQQIATEEKEERQLARFHAPYPAYMADELKEKTLGT